MITVYKKRVRRQESFCHNFDIPACRLKSIWTAIIMHRNLTFCRLISTVKNYLVTVKGYKVSRDRLDGTHKKRLIVELYLLPGRVLLWLGYMFPGKGYSGVRQSARAARSPIMTFISSTAFWFFLGYSIYKGWFQVIALGIIKAIQNSY